MSGRDYGGIPGGIRFNVLPRENEEIYIFF